MKTIDNLLEHYYVDGPKVAYPKKDDRESVFNKEALLSRKKYLEDITAISEFKARRVGTSSQIHKMKKYQIEYNTIMHKLQVEMNKQKL